LLSLFNNGTIQDSYGRIANGRDAIFILTSNFGSQVILTYKGEKSSFAIAELFNNLIKPLIKSDHDKRGLRPELLDRISESALFFPLSHSELEDVAELKLNVLRTQLWENKRQVLYWQKNILKHLIPKNAQGARQITLSEIRNALTLENAPEGSLIIIMWKGLIEGQVGFPYIISEVDSQLHKMYHDESRSLHVDLKKKKRRINTKNL